MTSGLRARRRARERCALALLPSAGSWRLVAWAGRSGGRGAGLVWRWVGVVRVARCWSASCLAWWVAGRGGFLVGRGGPGDVVGLGPRARLHRVGALGRRLGSGYRFGRRR